MKKAEHIIQISSERPSLGEKWRQIVRFKELLWTLSYKDIKVKYAQTFIGIAWSFINPIFTTIVITFVFKKVADVNTGEMPHTLFTLVGMIGWVYVASVIQQAGSSLIGSQESIKKIYFPRVIIPFSKAIAGLLNFGIMFVCLVILLLIYGIVPSSNIIYLPFFLLMTILAGLGIGIWISALSIRFRDLTHAIPILLRIGMFISPIAYPAAQIRGWLGWINFFYYFNPLTGVIEGIRWSILGTHGLNNYIFISYGIILFLFISGLKYFFYIEHKIADII